MLTTSVIIILREVLEIALMLSIMLAATWQLKLSLRWLGYSFIIGLLTAWLYASTIQVVSEWFDGVGQEIVNAFMQFLLYLLLGSLGIKLLNARPEKTANYKNITLIMAACIILAATREGYEIIIYLSGFLTDPSTRFPVLLGSAIGTGIGISTGAIIYYILISIDNKRAFRISAYALIAVAAGMLLQGSLLLTQADWLSNQQVLWDSSWLISESSITGQLLYALIGYEATPTTTQASIYFIGLSSLLAIAILTRAKPNKHRNQSVGD
jgi:high-affinity iron transporter